jgi:hypothetical protein
VDGLYIAEWDWRDGDVEHLATHGVQPADVLAVWWEEPRYRRNRKNRAASHQMVGPDGRGGFFAIYIRHDAVETGRWRAITGRAATAGERSWWEGKRHG